MSVRLFFVVGIGVVLGCGGLLDGPEDAVDAVQAPVVVAPALYEVVPDADVTPAATVAFAALKAGSTQGMVTDMTVALVGPAPAAGGPQPLVGSARVTEVTQERARLVPLRLVDPLPSSMAARMLSPDDSAALAAIPEVMAAKPGLRRAPGPAAAIAASDDALVIPADLKSGSADDREDALVRHEDEPGATGAIVWVMKNDPSESVRFKAWRVVRARWKRGTGSEAEHEAAAVWLAANGPKRSRIEAVEAIGNLSTGLSHAAAQLNDSDEDLRMAAAGAVADVGDRSGKRDSAREMLRARRDKESSSAVRKKLDAAIDRL